MTNIPQQYPGQQPPSYPGDPGVAGTPATPKKPWFKKWWVWLLAVVVIGGIGQAMGQGGSSQTNSGQAASSQSSSPVAAKAKLTLDDGWTVDKSDGYVVYVNGYVSNNTDKAITNYVQITFDALDKQNANLGTCLANTNTIDANGKWKFKAICADQAKEIAQVRFKEITGF